MAPSPTGRLVLLEGSSVRVLSAELETTTEFDVGRLGRDATLVALDEAVLIATEEELGLWSFSGRDLASLRLEPWGGGLRGAVARIADSLWSIHMPEDPVDAELPWVLARLDPNDLTVTDRADLSHVDADHFTLFDLRGGRVGVDLHRAPDYVGSLSVRLEGSRLVVTDATRPGELGQAQGAVDGKLLARTPTELIVADALSHDVVARASLVDVFGVSESGGSRDDSEHLLRGPGGALLVHTTLGHLGQLDTEGGRLRFTPISLPGVEIETLMMDETNLSTGFRGAVTRESTDVEVVVACGEDRCVTVHAGGRGHGRELRLWRLE